MFRQGNSLLCAMHMDEVRIVQSCSITHLTKAIISTGALRLPTTFDNHLSNPIPSIPTYSCEDDLSIEDLI